MSDDRKLTKQLVVRVDADLLARLQKDADDNGRTVAQTVRFLLARSLPQCSMPTVAELETMQTEAARDFPTWWDLCPRPDDVEWGGWDLSADYAERTSLCGKYKQCSDEDGSTYYVERAPAVS